MLRMKLSTWLYAAMAWLVANATQCVAIDTTVKTTRTTTTRTHSLNSQKYTSLKSWALANGARLKSVSIQSVTSNDEHTHAGTIGSGLFALEPMHAGQIFLSLPMPALLTTSSSRASTDSIDEVQDPILRLAAVLLHEYQTSRNLPVAESDGSGESEWAPFVKSLPWQMEATPRVLWRCSIQDLTFVTEHGSGVLYDLMSRALERSAYVTAWFHAIYGDYVEDNRPSLALWKTAVVIVTSRIHRVWVAGVSGGEGSGPINWQIQHALVPLADLMNHPGTTEPNARCATAKTPKTLKVRDLHSSSASSVTAHIFECRVLRDVAANTQLAVDYISDSVAVAGAESSRLSNRELWETYGFTTPAKETNDHEERTKYKSRTTWQQQHAPAQNVPEITDIGVGACQYALLALLPPATTAGVVKLLESRCIRCADLLRVYEELITEGLSESHMHTYTILKNILWPSSPYLA